MTTTQPNDRIQEIVKGFGFTPKDSLVVDWKDLSGKLLVTQRADIASLTNEDGFQEFFAPIEYLEPARAEMWLFGSASELSEDFLDQITNSVDVERIIEVNTKTNAFTTTTEIGVIDGEINPIISDKLTREGLKAAFTPTTTKPPIPLKENLSADWCLATAHGISKSMNGHPLPEPVNYHWQASMLRDVTVRDLVIREMIENKITPDPAYLKGICNALEPGAGANARVVAAIASWMNGNGAQAAVIAGTTLESDATHNLSLMIQSAVGNGISPQVFQESIREVTQEEILAPKGLKLPNPTPIPPIQPRISAMEGIQ